MIIGDAIIFQDSESVLSMRTQLYDDFKYMRTRTCHKLRLCECVAFTSREHFEMSVL